MRRSTPFHALPRIEAGANMPSGRNIMLADTNERVRAEAASDALLDALRRYAERHDALLLEAIRTATGRRW